MAYKVNPIDIPDEKTTFSPRLEHNKIVVENKRNEHFS